MQKKWNEYQIIDTRQLVNRLPEDEREQFKHKVLFKNKTLTDKVMMFSKSDFKKYRENNDAYVIGRIKKHQKHYKVYETEVKNYIDTIKDKYMFNLPKTLIVQNGVTNISNLAFYNCTSLSNVTISDSVTSIGLGAFAGCTNLININIPDSVTSIGHYIFDYTSSSLVIYCQTQAVADFLKETLSGSWNIVVDATKF